MASELPEWYRSALDDEVHDGTIEFEGTAIAYRRWGPTDSQSLVVLLHGGAAHSRWWDHVAPLLARDRLVVAPDLSGHGDSGRRTKYTHELWAREVMAVAAHAAPHATPTLVGHSMGGFVALTAACLYGSSLAGLITIDAPVGEVSPEEELLRRRRASTAARVVRDFDEAVSRFRPLPASRDGDLPWVVDHIARLSVRAVDDGWTWKFDPRMFDRAPLRASELAPVECPVAILRGEFGMLTAPMAAAVRANLGGSGLVVEVPAAGHNIMLDQPLQLVTALRILLATWAS